MPGPDPYEEAGVTKEEAEKQIAQMKAPEEDGEYSLVQDAINLGGRVVEVDQKPI